MYGATLTPFFLLGIIFTFSNPCAPLKQNFGMPDAGMTVETIRVQYTSVPETFVAEAQVLPLAVTTISAPFSGTIERVFVKSGQSIGSGDLLFLYSGESLQEKLILKQKRLTELTARLAHANSLMSTYSANTPAPPDTVEFLDDAPIEDAPLEIKFGKQDLELVPTPQTIEALKTMLEASVQTLNTEVLHLTNLQTKLSVFSPAGGDLETLHISEAQNVIEGQSLAQLVTNDVLQVLFEVPQNLASVVDRELTVKICAKESVTLCATGQVTEIGGNLNQNQNLPLKASITNHERYFKGQQIVQIELATLKKRDVLILPVSAIKTIDEQDFIYTIVNHRAKKIPITKTLACTQTCQVTANLRVDDLVLALAPETDIEGQLIKSADAIKKE